MAVVQPLSRLRMSDESDSEPAAPSGSALQFLNFSNPSEWQEPGVRHTIRSHVTRQQHQRNRKTSDKPQSSKSKSSSRPEQSTSGTSSESSKHAESSGSGARTPGPLAPYTRQLGTSLSRTTREQVTSTTSATSKVFLILNPSVSGVTRVKGLHVDTQPIWNKYITLSGSRSPALERRSPLESSSTESSQGHVFTCNQTDMAPYSAAVLLTLSHVSCLRNESVQTHVHNRLRDAALHHLHEAIRNSESGISDSLVVAVIILAMYESIYGSQEVYNAHIQGLVNLIPLRGGISNLGLNGVFNKLVVLYQNELDCSSLISRTLVPEGD